MSKPSDAGLSKTTASTKKTKNKNDADVDVAVEPVVELTETQKVQLQCDNATLESLESTRRMLLLCEESKEAGIKTLVMLDEQGEQLDRIEEGADKINQDMREAEKNLEGLEKCCGLCVLPWNKSKNYAKGDDYNNTWKANDDGKVNTNAPRRQVGTEGQGVATSGFINRITNDAREDEMDENIVQVNSMMSNLRNMAIDMGNEIENQNQLIDRVNKKADSAGIRITAADKRAKTILKNS